MDQRRQIILTIAVIKRGKREDKGNLSINLRRDNKGKEFARDTNSRNEIKRNVELYTNWSAFNYVYIKSNILPHNKIYKVIWMQLDKKTEHQIVHFIIFGKRSTT